MRDDVDDIRIGVRANQVVFEVDGLALSSRLIDGQFPNYRQLLPEAYEHELTIDREELLEVVRRISLMAQKNAPLRLSFSEGEVSISAQTPDVGEASEPRADPVRRRTVRHRLQPGLPDRAGWRARAPRTWCSSSSARCARACSSRPTAAGSST